MFFQKLSTIGRLFCACFFVLSCAATPARGDQYIAYINSTNYTMTVTHVPDFDQRRLLLPGQGSMYCVPTAATNWMAYFANHGHPTLPPGSGNWQDAALYNTATSWIEFMGDLMDTDPVDGTGGGGWSGLFAYIWNWQISQGNFGFPTFIVTKQNSNGSWSPTFQNLAERALDGGYVSAGVGWYNEFIFEPEVIERVGGHHLSMNKALRSGSSMQIGWRDPARDEGSMHPFRLLLQSPFASESYAVQNFSKQPILGGTLQAARTMSRVVGYGSAWIDNYLAVTPPFVVNTGPDELTIKIQLAFQPFGGGAAMIKTFAALNGQQIVGLSLHPDLSKIVYVSKTAGSPLNSMFVLTPATAETVQIAGPSVIDPRAVCIGRHRGLYFIDREDTLRCVDLDVSPPQVVATRIAPHFIDALACDDTGDEVLVLSVADRKIIKYAHSLQGDPQVTTVPEAVPLAGKAVIATHPPAAVESGVAGPGEVWIASDASDSIYHLRPLGPNEWLLIETLTHPGLLRPSAISMADTGRLLVTAENPPADPTLWEYARNQEGVWELVPNPAWPGLQSGKHMQVATSRTNFLKGLHDAPDFDDVLPEEDLGNPSELDCPADIAPAPLGDGQVNVDDLLALLAAWGKCPAPCAADFAPAGPPVGDESVNVDDLLFLLQSWGICQ